MPRLFYKIVVGLVFALAGLVLLLAEAAVSMWLVSWHPNLFAWAAYVLFSFVDITIFLAFWDVAVEYVKRA